MPQRKKFFAVFFIVFFYSTCAPGVFGREDRSRECLTKRILEILNPILEDSATFTFVIKAGIQPISAVTEPRVSDKPKNGEAKAVEIFLSRLSRHSWRLNLKSPWRDVEFFRDENESKLVIPKAGLTFVGKGKLSSTTDTLEPVQFLERFVTPETMIYPAMAFMSSSTIETGLNRIVFPFFENNTTETVTDGDFIWRFPQFGHFSVNSTGSPKIKIEISSGSKNIENFRYFEIFVPNENEYSCPSFLASSELQVDVSRDDLEKMIFRGLRRILSLKLPGTAIMVPPSPRSVQNGELKLIDGQILVILQGNPEEIGTAHGKLLGDLFQRTVDSTLYLVGLVETISQGKWFLDELEEAWKRTSPFIPEYHLRELNAIASSCPSISWREARLANIFPEYFHCSGFSVFGKATKDGVLYHGRVLDYMTEIGLQQAAAAFVVKPKGKNAFFNAGFAGFIGSVSGMNEKQISLGEMGGGGRYQWDGVPMTILMRRALEEANTLQDVKQIWASSPRTCEYFYVFSDGKISDAVAVKASPQTLEFLGPGISHPLLGEGIPDAVVLSAGNRLKALRQRVQENFGKIDAEIAMRLMDRPVAMKSNLHDVLFVPQKMEVYVAVASDNQPAAERPYVKYDFGELLKNLQNP